MVRHLAVLNMDDSPAVACGSEVWNFLTYEYSEVTCLRCRMGGKSA